MPKSKKRVPAGDKTSGKQKQVVRTVVKRKVPVSKSKALLDKQKASPATKLIALVIAVSFVIWLVIGSVTSIKGCTETPQSPIDAKHQPTIDDLKKRLTKESTSVALLTELGNEYFDWGVELQQNAQTEKDQETFARSQDMFSQSINYYQKVISMNPTNTAVRTDLSSAYYYTGRMEQSLTELKQVIQMDPDLAPAWFNLGLRYYEQQNTTETTKAWQRYLELDPQSQYADQIRAALLKMQQPATQTPTKTTK